VNHFPLLWNTILRRGAFRVEKRSNFVFVKSFKDKYVLSYLKVITRMNVCWSPHIPSLERNVESGAQNTSQSLLFILHFLCDSANHVCFFLDIVTKIDVSFGVENEGSSESCLGRKYHCEKLFLGDGLPTGAVCI